MLDQRKMGKSIAFLRKRYHMTQQELADRLGVSDKAISKWENGHGAPDISVLTKLSIILDTDIESILEGNLTHMDLQWKGVLILDYPRSIHPQMCMLTLPIVEFQLSFFLLAGITEIIIAGDEYNIKAVKENIDTGEQYGIKIEYMLKKGSTDVWLDEHMPGLNRKQGIFLIKGFDFIYGKDVTRCFRRIMHDGFTPIKLANSRQRVLSFFFYPCNTYFNHRKRDIEIQLMERGIIAFPVCNADDLWKASDLLHIIEDETGEKVACLQEIAMKRGLMEI